MIEYLNPDQDRNEYSMQAIPRNDSHNDEITGK
jgi:hypothetical protein